MDHLIPYLTLLLTYSSICKATRYQRYLYLQHLCLNTLEDEKYHEDQISNANIITGDENKDNYKFSVYKYNKYRYIMQLLAEVEMNLEFDSSLRFRGILSTYAIPSISKVLHSTGGFELKPKRRYADMELIINEFVDNEMNDVDDVQTKLCSKRKTTSSVSNQDIGVDPLIRMILKGSFSQDKQVEIINNNTTNEREVISPVIVNRPLRSLYRLNTIHNKYGQHILYQDMMYVLSVFAVAPMHWADNEKWSMRPFSLLEKECLYRYWVQVGNIMNLHVEDQWDNVQVRYDINI